MNRRIVLLAAAGIPAAGLGAAMLSRMPWLVGESPPFPAPAPQVIRPPQDALRTAPGPASATIPRSVLFIGNSYTMANDLPWMLLEIAASDPNNPVRLSSQMVAYNSIRLAEHYARGDAVKALNSRRWDVVVMQEQSEWPVYDWSLESAFEAAALWKTPLAQSGATVLLYETWARKPGSTWYDGHLGLDYTRFDAMQGRLDEMSPALARRLGGTVVPVGPFWRLAIEKAPDINLYDVDGSHPNVAGSFFSALIFYRTLTARLPTSASYVPPGMRAPQAKRLAEIASL